MTGPSDAPPVKTSELAPTLEELIRFADGHGVRVRLENLRADSAGGLCTIKGERHLLLDRRAPEREQLRQIADAIVRLDLPWRRALSNTARAAIEAVRDRRPAASTHSSTPPRATVVHPPKPGLRRAAAGAPVTSRSPRHTGQPLGDMCTLGIGGPAEYFVEALTDADAIDAVRWANDHRADLRILGGGSNVVVNDLGVPGVVLKIATKGVSLEAASSDRTLLHAAAGEVWDELVALSVNHDLAGLECLSGIPGHVGATPIQNVGAYGQEVAHTIAGVRAYDRQTGDVVDLAPRQCEFSYRNSIFKTRQPGRYVVLRVSFRLAPGGAPTLAYTELERSFAAGTPELAEVRERVLQLRRAKSMVWSPTDPNRRSCGSFFTNPYVAPSVHEKLVGEFGPNVPAWPQGDRVKLSAGWLIERSGLHKGMTDGAAGLSTKHALALVCHEGATSNDVLRLAHRIRDTVRARTSVLLEPEPNFWGFPDGSERLPPLG